jgi:hypothetical protein
MGGCPRFDAFRRSRVAGPSRFGGPRCQTDKGCSSKGVKSEHTGSTFLLPFTLYRCTKFVAYTASSLFAVGYA